MSTCWIVRPSGGEAATSTTGVAKPRIVAEALQDVAAECAWADVEVRKNQVRQDVTRVLERVTF